jgi:hypothetical protein
MSTALSSENTASQTVERHVGTMPDTLRPALAPAARYAPKQDRN